MFLLEMKLYHKLLLYKNKFLEPYVRFLFRFLNIIMTLSSLLLIGAVVYEHGFKLDNEDIVYLYKILRFVWIFFLFVLTSHLIFEFKEVTINYKQWTWILSSLFYLTLIPVIFLLP